MHLLHVVPVGHDAVLDRVLEREDATLRLRLVADVRVLLAHANHHTRLARAADDRREDGTRGVIAREAGLFRAREKSESGVNEVHRGFPGGAFYSGRAHLAHAGAVVNNKSRNLVLRHLCFESVCLVAARGAGRERR